MPSKPEGLTTLAIDVGGTGVKTILLNERGRPITDRQRVDTPNPATPDAILGAVDQLIKSLGAFDRVSVGFPGVVKHGATLTAHNLDPTWIGFDLEKVLSRKWRKPVRVANDAAVQGYGAIRGRGVELVITLGTGLGSSLFTSGHLVPGLELAHHPWKKKQTYEEFLGRKGLKRLGRQRWNKEVEEAITQIEALFNFDHLYIGGGNATKIDFPLPRHVTRVPNEDGLIGGVALWRDFATNATLRGESPPAAKEKAT
jgi:polyphosphate glucokinase